MLRTLTLTKFGRFRNRSFEFKPVTLFLGANESGKTTVFDAIRLTAFSPPRRGREKLAYERYGADPEVDLDWVDGPPPVSYGEFMNLFAIHGGDMTPDFSQDWVGSLKKRLFAGGIDLSTLHDALALRGSDKGQYKHMRAHVTMEREYSEISNRLHEKTKDRDRILSELETLVSQSEAMGHLESELTAAQAKLGRLTAEGAEQEQIQRRVELEARLTALTASRDLTASLQERKQFATDETEALTALERMHLEARESMRAAEGEGEQARAALSEAQAREETLAAERAGTQPWTRAMDGIGAVLDEARREQDSVPISVGSLLLPSLMLATVGAGFVALGLQSGDPATASFFPGILSGLAGAPGYILAAIFFAMSVSLPVIRLILRRRAASANDARVLAQVRGLCAAAMDAVSAAMNSGTMDSAAAGNFTAGAAIQAAGSLAELERARHEALRELERAGSRQVDRQAAVSSARRQVQQAGARLQEISAKAGAAESSLAQWFKARGVASRDGYRDAVSAYRNDIIRGSELNAEIEAWIEQGNYPSRDTLRTVTESGLRELDALGVPRAPLPREQREQTLRDIGAARKQVEDIAARRNSGTLQLTGSQEYHHGQLGRLPEDIAALSQQVQDLEQGLADADFDRQAAALAAEMVHDLAADESAVLRDLAGSVGEMYSSMTRAEESGLGETHRAAVELTALEGEALSAEDLWGESRNVADLSQGTQQVLFLALRLEMARRGMDGANGILSFDEPFAYLDPERMQAALIMLRRFLEETGWQMILFTSDPAQADAVQAAFPECALHRLP